MSAPFTFRRWVERASEDVEQVLASARAAGLPVTEENVDAVIESRCSADLLAELPPDAVRYAVEQEIARQVQEFLDEQVAAGLAERLPDGSYRRL